MKLDGGWIGKAKRQGIDTGIDTLDREAGTVDRRAWFIKVLSTGRTAWDDPGIVVVQGGRVGAPGSERGGSKLRTSGWVRVWWGGR